MQTFYRFHWDDCPEFSAANAWSALWGPERSADGSQSACGCGGNDPDCAPCGGTGWQDCAPGYSACWDAEDLVEYFAAHGEPADGDGRVIVFTGRCVGTGFDGEPLAVPAGVVRTATWTEFTASLSL